MMSAPGQYLLRNFKLCPLGGINFCVSYMLEWSGLLTPCYVNTWKVSPAKLSPGSPSYAEVVLIMCWNNVTSQGKVTCEMFTWIPRVG